MMFRVFDQPGSVYFGTCLQFVSNKCKCIIGMVLWVFDQAGSVYFGTCLQFVSNKCKCKMCPTGGGSLNTHINSYRPWTSPGRLICKCCSEAAPWPAPCPPSPGAR